MQNSSETRGFSKAVDRAKQFTDTIYIDNVRWKFINIQRLDGHCFKAVQVLQRSFANKDKFLIFDYNDSSDGSPAFVLRSSKWKVEVLNNLKMDGNHCLVGETVTLMFYITGKIFLFFLLRMLISSILVTD